MKSALKQAIQKSVVKTYPLTDINLCDDEVENLKDRKNAMNRTAGKGGFGAPAGKGGFGATAGKGGFGATAQENATTLSLYEESEMVKALPKAEPIPDDILELDYVKGILAISSRDLANCILSQDWKMRKAGLLIIAKQAKYL